MKYTGLDEKGESLAESLVTFFIAVMCAFMIVSAVSTYGALTAATAEDAGKTYAQCSEIERFIAGKEDADGSAKLIIKCGGVTDEAYVDIKRAGDFFAFRER